MMDRVAIVLPLPRAQLSAAEALSVASLRRHLDRYPKVLLMPDGLHPPFDGFDVRRFPPRFFRGRHTYSELLVGSDFYTAFADFDYILIYQLDCLVFGDQLEQWCDRGFDYIGAPWVGRDAGGKLVFTGVGNGGFSLRRVRACLEVTRRAEAKRRLRSPLYVPRRFARLVLRYARRGLRAIGRGDNVSLVERSRNALAIAAREAVPEYRNEDLFWAAAPSFVPSFRIPDARTAVDFCFEAEPRFCFEQNQGRLPFGCHQWEVHDPEFWESYLPTALDGR